MPNAAKRIRPATVQQFELEEAGGVSRQQYFLSARRLAPFRAVLLWQSDYWMVPQLGNLKVQRPEIPKQYLALRIVAQQMLVEVHPTWLSVLLAKTIAYRRRRTTAPSKRISI